MLTVTLEKLENQDSRLERAEAECYERSLSYEWRFGRPVVRQIWRNMREVNGFFLFELGGIALLAALSSNVDLTPSLGILVTNRTLLRNFADAPENKQDLQNSVDDANDLVKKLDSIIERKPFPCASPTELSELGFRLITFRDRLCAELARIYSFVFEDKDGRSVKTLWTRSLSLISSVVVSHLSEFTTENFEEAAKAWVVDRPTAVGFHMMRSVEHVLREYKQLVTGQGFSFVDRRGTTQYQGFGTLVGDLNKKLDDQKKTAAPFGKLELVIGILRPLSRLYRDPLSHPELKKLEEEDAKVAFGQGISAISTMVQDALDGGMHFARPWQNGMKF